MLTAIIEDTSVDFFDDNATYRFMFTENATNEDKLDWLAGYSNHLESVIVGDTFNLKESDLADNVYTEYTPTKTFSNVLLAPYRFNAFANPSDSPPLPPNPDTQATFETGDRLGTYDAIVKGMGSFDIDNYTYFEWEYERNEANRQIRYVRPEYISRFAEEYKRLINL